MNHFAFVANLAERKINICSNMEYSDGKRYNTVTYIQHIPNRGQL